MEYTGYFSQKKKRVSRISGISGTGWYRLGHNFMILNEIIQPLAVGTGLGSVTHTQSR
jgi:hypothetical protein